MAKSNYKSNNKGFAPIAIILLVVAILAIGAGIYWWQKSRGENTASQPAETAVSTSSSAFKQLINALENKTKTGQTSAPTSAPAQTTTSNYTSTPAQKSVIQKCTDGTIYGQCSTSKPKYCDDGNLINRVSLCSCPLGYKISDNQCILDVSIKYRKIGIVYISESNETYNVNWRTDFYPNKGKIENALNDIFSKKGEKFIVDFIGEFRPNNLCWNPSRIAFIQEFINYPNSLEKGWYIKMPGGEISRGAGNYTCLPKHRKTLWSDCDSTRCEEFNHPDFPDSQCFRVKCDQKSFPLSLQNLSWINPLLNNFKSNNLDLSNYDYKVIVLGKAGLIIPQTGEKEKQFLCKTMTTGDIMGYASDVIVMTENGLETPSYYKCPDFTRFTMPGWQQIVHEILHKFGAVDIYEFDWQKNPNREEALKLEPENEVDKSVMANGWYGYCNKYGTTYSCTAGDLEKIYLDKYNKIKLGLE